MLSPADQERFRQLEADIRRLSALLDRAPEREAQVGMPRNPRLAKTVADGTYPTESDNTDTFNVVFLDSIFTEAEGDQTPTHTSRQTDPAAFAHNLTGEWIPENTVVIVTRDNGRWWIVELPFRRRWAKAQSDWIENGTYPSGDPKVSVKSCDRDGTNVRGDAFDVYLPRNPRSPSGNEHDADPAVYTNYVIAWELDEEGTRVCCSPYLHMRKIGALRMIHDDGSIPTGWAKCDGSSKTGPAGTFNLLNFVKNYGGSDYRCGPVHPITGDTPGDQVMTKYFDRLGIAPRQRTAGDASGYAYCSDNAGNAIDGTNRSAYRNGGPAHDVDVNLYSADGEFFDTVVWFIQRYK